MLLEFFLLARGKAFSGIPPMFDQLNRGSSSNKMASNSLLAAQRISLVEKVSQLMILKLELELHLMQKETNSFSILYFSILHSV